MAKKSVKNVVLFTSLKMVGQTTANNSFYANNVASGLSLKTAQRIGKKKSLRNMSLVNRRFNNLRTSLAELKRPFRNTLINIKMFNLVSWLPARLLSGWTVLFLEGDTALSSYDVLP
mgnify:CR=1 FL=1